MKDLARVAFNLHVRPTANPDRRLKVTILCDFQWVHGVGTGVNIGDSQPVWEQPFSTGGRHKNGNAVLVFMIRGLTGSNEAEVRLNNQLVGRITPYPGANPSHWYMQMINVTGGPLLDGTNELQVHAAPATNPSPGDIYDDFQLKNILCIFQQSS
jgi:hypothetical protein